MTERFSKAGRLKDYHLPVLHKRIMNDASNTRLLQDFFNKVVANDEIDAGRAFLDQLQEQNPWNHHIRKLRIALCLLKNRYKEAMAAIETLMAFSTPDDGLIESALSVREHLGAKAICRPSGGAPSLSLCMIVKNEKSFLGACLNSIKNLVDEIIVVDTGSNDRSADIATIFGAQVYDFQWCDDFSAARNHSLEQASGEWILILDADEVIAPQDELALKQYIEKGERARSAFSLQTRNYSNLANMVDWQANDSSYPLQETGLGWFPTNKVRLFPRSNAIRFIYPVHELVDPSIRSAGLKLSKCPIPVHHYGYLNEKKRLQKVRQYFDLGYAKLERLGNDRVSLRELAIQAGQLERWPQTVELWQRFLELSEDRGEAYANLAGAHWQLGKFDLGVAYSKKAIKANPGLKEGYLNLAVNQLFGGDTVECVHTLNQLLQRQPDYLSAEFMLAAALIISGNSRKGIDLLSALAKKISDETITAAINDLIHRCAVLGAPQYGVELERAALQLRCKNPASCLKTS